MIVARMIAVVLLLGAACAPLVAVEPISRIAIGSCADENRPQPIWSEIVKYQPELFLFLGDNIYGDTEDMEVLKAKYAKLGAQPGFAKLRATCPVLATWDDHDYGVNDGGADYPKRAESQQVFNDFFEVPVDSPRRQRPGIYDAQTFGPEGRRVQIILLDTRYFRSKLRTWPPSKRPRGAGPYVARDDRRSTILGEAQWKWLAEQLRQPAELRIIATSFQFVPDGHYWESWSNFPRERQKLLQLIAETKASGVLFVSGDRHHAEISKLAPQDDLVNYPLYDLTSSSLNRPGGGNKREKNDHRISDIYSPINFGTITIDWQVADPTIALTVHDSKGKPVRETKLTLGDLQAK